MHENLSGCAKFQPIRRKEKREIGACTLFLLRTARLVNGACTVVKNHPDTPDPSPVYDTDDLHPYHLAYDNSPCDVADPYDWNDDSIDDI